jgi:hypothetical protein
MLRHEFLVPRGAVNLSVENATTKERQLANSRHSLVSSIESIQLALSPVGEFAATLRG